MIDLHAHLLPGLDDGPASLAASVEMARAAHEAGIRTVACTPHMSERFPTEPATVVEAVRVLGEALEAADVALEVVPGVEIAPSARLSKVIVDRGVDIPDGLVVGEDPDLDARRFRRTDSGICLITQPMLDRLE